MTLDQFAQSECCSCYAEPFLHLGCFHCISTQIRLSNSLPSLHSLPLYSLNSSISVDTVLVNKSVYSQLADVSPGLGPERKALLLTLAWQCKNNISLTVKYVICNFSPFPHSFLGNPLFFVTPFVLYFFCCCLFAVVNCTDPGHLENSIRQVQPSGPHRFSFGTTVSYQCSHGYYLLGTHVLTCQGDGTWDRALPQCLCKFFRIIPIQHRSPSHVLLCRLAEW